MCLNIGTPSNHYFPFGTNGKVLVLGVPILKHIRVCPFSFLPTFFLKDNSITIKDRKLIFGVKVDKGKLNRRIENWLSTVYPSLYLFLCLSLYFFHLRYHLNYTR